MIIEAHGIGYTYMAGLPGEVRALESASLKLEPGKMHGLVGASGSGKTTAAQIISGLLDPSAGEVLVDGSRADPAFLRSVVAMAFQFPENQIFEDTAFDDVAFGPRHLGRGAREVESLVKGALELLELDADQMRVRSPFSLSVGEKRRIALAGILAMERPFVVLDEPTAGLDEHLCSIVSQMVRSLCASGKGVLLISHDTDVVFSLSDNVTVLRDGVTIYTGAPDDIFTNGKKLEESGLTLPTSARLARLILESHPELYPDLVEKLKSIRLH